MRNALIVAILLIAGPVCAQTRERLPWFTIDAHAATVGLPQAEGWVPDVSADTELPGRNWGLSTGATVYPFRPTRLPAHLPACRRVNIQRRRGPGRRLSIP